MDDSAKGRYDKILGRDVLTAWVLNLELYEHFIKSDDGPLKVFTAPMIDLGTYEFLKIKTSTLHPNNRLWMLTQNK